MLRYVLKVAQLDENLIVKQKARFLSHVIEYKDSIDLSSLLTKTTDEPSNRVVDEDSTNLSS